MLRPAGYGLIVLLGATSLILFSSYSNSFRSDQNGFWQFFESAKLPMSRDGNIPRWQGSLHLCVYGATPQHHTRKLVDSFSRVISSLPQIAISVHYVKDVLDCEKKSDLFMWLQQGDVYRTDVQKNYQAIIEISGVNVDVTQRKFYQSAFGQTAFLADGKRAVAAILVNQVSENNELLENSFLEANLLEELYQTIAIAADIPLDGKRKSILEERLLHTPEMWQGNFDADEVIDYLENRPNGICHWDVKLLALLYGMRVPNAEPASYKRVLTTREKEHDKKTAILIDAFKHNGLFDSGCGIDLPGED